MSTVNKSLVNNLRLVDPEGKSIKITCTILQDDGKIQDQDLKDAAKYGVNLKGAKRPRGSKRGKKPDLQWLDECPGAYYRHLQDDSYDFIIGHAPYVANGCLNLRELYKVKKESPKIILMFLEESNRKLINIKSASLIFKLFCPTKNSVLQIQDDKSKIELQEKMKKLLKALGMF